MRYLLGSMLAVVLLVMSSNAVERWQTRNQLRVHVHASERQVVVLGDLRVPDRTPVHYELARADAAAGRETLRGVAHVRNGEFGIQREIPAGGPWRLRLHATSGERSWQHQQEFRRQ